MNFFIRLIESHPLLSRLLRYDVYARRRSVQRESLFQEIYENNGFGGDASRSGPGSSLESTESLRKSLPPLIAALGAKSLLDVPCGDFHWMSQVPLEAKYYGADIVDLIIRRNIAAFGDRGEFLHLDLVRDPLPTADMILCRDCLVHLSFREIHQALDNIKRAAPRFLLATTFPDVKVNVDMATPDWRPLNLQLPPFNFSEPIELIKDFAESQVDHHGKYVGVWRMQDIAAESGRGASRR